ncbi:alanine racemase [Microbacterium sp.]|uniref:alanine racemase n=1 Tax=Microbacterium sp. TaxID=51671 RepID=UPI00281279BB|nr:alanine racemase C-terminal domain-containing protein [Microbacterium sp.]
MEHCSALPTAVLSRSALTARAARLVEGRVVDLRHDAYGHGLDGVAQLVADAGAAAILVDDDAASERVRAAGVRALTDPDRARVTAEVDPGALFGIPGAGDTVPARDAPPVMRLEGQVLSTKPLHAGEAVSYGYTHRAPHDTRVALVTGGYAQGIVRALGNRVRVEVAGAMRPVVGRIAMDVCVVDLEGHDVEAGAPVVYFGGDGPACDALASWEAATGMSALELVVVVGRHVRREWVA